MADRLVDRDEIEAALAARHELGAEMEPEIVDAVVERIERRLADRAGAGERALALKREHQKEMVLASMAISIPMLAIAAVFTGLPGVIAVCVALAVIAVVTAR